MTSTDISFLDSTSVKIFVKGQFVGTGVLYRNGADCYAFTAAHVLYGKFYDKHIIASDIWIETNANLPLKEACQDIITTIDFNSTDTDIAAIKLNIPSAESLPNYGIVNEVAPDSSYFFRGCPSQAKNQFRNFWKYELNDHKGDKFKLKGPAEDFIYLSSAGDNSQDGLSGSGIFFCQDGLYYLYGIFIGTTDEDAAYCLVDGIKITALKENLSLDCNDPLLKSAVLLDRLDVFKRKIEQDEITKFLMEKHFHVSNLKRKMEIICGQNEAEAQDKVKSHIESFLFGSAFLEHLQETFGQYYKEKHDELLESYKRSLKQGVALVFGLKEAVDKYETFRKEYEHLVVQEFSKYSLSQAGLKNLSCFGIASCLAICEFDIRYNENQA